jgi:hypothetical protein
MMHHVFHRRALGGTVAVDSALPAGGLLGTEGAPNQPLAGILEQGGTGVAQLPGRRPMNVTAIDPDHCRDRFLIENDIARATWRRETREPTGHLSATLLKMAS